MTYQEALDYIASLAPRGWRLGLDRMFELVRRADLWDAIGHGPRPKFIHIAGTNGKGTVTAFVQALLTAHGHKTGAFFSPYVYDPRERIQIDGALISEDKLAALTERLMPIAESLSETEFGGITEFEVKTALGFMHWAEEDCDWVALEVGLGGRLDATNVVQPASTAITSISLDHTAILGGTLGAIAREKAGVIKPGVPVVVGTLPSDALGVIESVAAEHEAPLWRLGNEVALTLEPTGLRIETSLGAFSSIVPAMEGSTAPANVALAVALCQTAGIDLNEGLVRQAIASTVLPARFERRVYRGRRFILDGAHNAESSRALAGTLGAAGIHDAVLLTGMVQGHDPLGFYRELAPMVRSVHFVPIDFPRAIPPVDLLGDTEALFQRSCAHGSLSEGLACAIEECGEDGTVLVTGSFYLVGAVGREMATACSDSRSRRP